MSGSQAGAPPQGAAADPSMEDILASIRRILSEDEAAAGSTAEPAPPPLAEPDVLALDTSMLVVEPPQAAPPEPSPAEPALPDPGLPPDEPGPPEPVALEAPALAEQAVEPDPSVTAEPVGFEPVTAGLVAPEAAAAAASSVGTLVRTLAEHHSLSVYRGGPTLEDIVREEMRPILKAWLDENLPPLVERLVRAEIERVVGRAAS